jgi:crotonobetainyl-CoA:carnitine CoA-transferase CaiB-like acyl-CoA transferase
VAGPLTGVKLIDLTTVGMGPYATQILGDMGADVIKVEAPEGDPFRDIAPSRNPQMGATFLNLNRNKRSIVLDLKQTDDRSILLDLLSGADVFVTNIRPKALRKLGLDHAGLKDDFPRLIHCSLTGFSEGGPFAGRPAFDDIIQAMSGMASLQGHNSGQPEYVNAIVADKVAGLAAVGAISMALFERERSGEGQAIEVPMFEFMVSFNQVEHMAGATFLPASEGAGYARVLSPHRCPYKTQDGYISILPYSSAHWIKFFQLAGRPDLAGDPTLADPSARSRNIDGWYELLAELIAQRPTQEWLDLFADADIPIAPIRSLDELMLDPELIEAGLFRWHHHPSEGEILGAGIPISFSRTGGSVRSLAPRMDEHREEILKEARALKRNRPEAAARPAARGGGRRRRA